MSISSSVSSNNNNPNIDDFNLQPLSISAQQNQENPIDERTTSVAQVISTSPSNKSSSSDLQITIGIDDIQKWISLTDKIISFLKTRFDLSDVKNQNLNPGSTNRDQNIIEINKRLDSLQSESERILKESLEQGEIERKRAEELREKYKKRQNNQV